MFAKILVATDGSDHAERALVVAANMASRFDAELTVLHAFSNAEMNEATRHVAEVEHLLPPRRQVSFADLGVADAPGLPIEPDEDVSSAGVMYQAAEKIGQIIAADGARIARSAGAPKVTSMARHGNPAQVILDVAKAEQVDLVVVGSRGLGNLEGMLIGSVSHKVNHLADCCCITVK